MKPITAFALSVFAMSAMAQTPAKKPVVTSPATTAYKPTAPSPDQLVEIKSIKQDIAEVQKKISFAEVEDQKYAGGLIKAQIQSRIETMKMTLAILEQKQKALETGARMSVVVPIIKADPVLATSLEGEITAQRLKIEQVRADADRYSGGLIKATKENTIATMESMVAMLEARALTAKYGLGVPQPAPSSNATLTPSPKNEQAKSKTVKDPANDVVTVQILNKRLSKEKYLSYIYFDLTFTATNLKKPARAIKGTLNLTDLFDEKIMAIEYPIERLVGTGETFTESGTGFKYNQFKDEHIRVNQIEQGNLKATYAVESILYQDGTREDF